jgi:DNA-binding transcriptional ArsR family regulator/ribosomal protein S25
MEGITSVSTRSIEEVAPGVTEELSLEIKKKNEKNYQSTIPIVGTFDDSKINIVLKSVDRSPGVRYRELLRLSGLTNGALEYTLRILEKRDRIKVERQVGKRPRYYPLDIMSSESSILGYIRNTSTRQIVLFMLEHNPCTFIEILKHIKKAPSTLSWHLKMLSEAGIIAIIRAYKHHAYIVVNGKLVSDVLNRYKDSLETKLLISNVR